MDTIPIRRSIHHDGRRFYATGKTGRRFDNGHAVSEYRHTLCVRAVLLDEGHAASIYKEAIS